jgi:PRTRC genetic system protein C
MARLFVYEGKEYPDPDPTMSTDEVRQSLANFFPELANAEMKTSKRGEDDIFTMAKRVGTKGQNAVIEVTDKDACQKLRELCKVLNGEAIVDKESQRLAFMRAIAHAILRMEGI